jgi:hypothetical protein
VEIDFNTQHHGTQSVHRQTHSTITNTAQVPYGSAMLDASPRCSTLLPTAHYVRKIVFATDNMAWFHTAISRTVWAMEHILDKARLNLEKPHLIGQPTRLNLRQSQKQSKKIHGEIGRWTYENSREIREAVLTRLRLVSFRTVHG